MSLFLPFLTYCTALMPGITNLKAVLYCPALMPGITFLRTVLPGSKTVGEKEGAAAKNKKGKF